MKIKICGMTRPEDVMKSEKSCVDLIGFINIERSKRFMEINEIKDLVSNLRDKFKAVLVIEPENPEEAIMKSKKTDIKTLQLHSLSKAEIKYLKWIDSYRKNAHERDLEIIRAVGISPGLDANERDAKMEEIKGFAMVCDALLFDYEVKGKSGGTGKQLPLDIVTEAAKAAKDVNNNIKIFIAGGMNAERIKNNRKMLNKVFDYVDVNSGVEDAPGIKNPDKIEDLCELMVD